MKCCFCKFAANKRATLGKLHSSEDELQRNFRDFSEHLFLGNILDDCLFQGTDYEKLLCLSVPVT